MASWRDTALDWLTSRFLPSNPKRRRAKLLPPHSKKMMDLNGKVAIVTGGTKGIGRAIAEALVREGIDVCVSARKRSEIDQTIVALAGLEQGTHHRDCLRRLAIILK